MFHHLIKDVDRNDWFRFVQAEYMMEILQREKYFGEPHTCHILARAIAPMIQARVVTGGFFTIYHEDGETKICENEHSWIALYAGWVLDLKPVGIMSRGPILVDTKSFGPGHVWYERYSQSSWPKVVRKQATQQSIRRMRRALADALVQEPLSKEDHHKRFGSLVH